MVDAKEQGQSKEGEKDCTTEGEENKGARSLPSLSSCGDMGPTVYERRVRDREDRMVKRAIREKWPIPEHMRARAVEVLSQVIESGEHRDKVSAVRALVSMEAQNMAAAGEGQVNSPVSTHIRNLIIQVGKGTDLPSLPADVVHTNQE